MQQYQEPTIETVVQQKKFPIWVLVAVALLIVAGGITAFLLLQPKQQVEPFFEETLAEPLQMPKKLSATLIFASVIRDNMTYEIQPNAKYVEGSTVMLYIGVSNFGITENLTVDVSEDIEIRDLNNNVIFSKTNFSRYNNTEKEPVNYIKFSNGLPSISLKPGKYIVDVKITDNIGGTSVIKSGEFTIVEKSKEVVERIVDLSEIVSSDLSKTKLVRQQTVFGPDGKIIPELSINETITTDLSKIDLKNIDASIKIPDKFDAGIYDVEVKYINLENGEFVSIIEKVEVIKELNIPIFAFANLINDDYSYVANPLNTYKKGDNVYIYLSVVDFAQPLVDGKYNVKFTEDVFIYDQNNQTIISEEGYIKVDDLNDERKNNYNIKNAFNTYGLEPGKYIYKAVIKDLNSGQKSERDEVFYIV